MVNINLCEFLYIMNVKGDRATNPSSAATLYHYG